ncbi:MAG: PEP-CTERM sorting domain-containing protein [Phenylobacterium sp.]|nr:MAG: PEP-CTERM sorting domain-containing protein [Phenylobacterium sp.]
MILDIASARGVPEPATWTMLIAGFGMVGAALRRRAGTLASA